MKRIAISLAAAMIALSAATATAHNDVRGWPMKECEVAIGNEVEKCDLPISESLLEYTESLCADREIPVTVALAVMKVESGFNAGTVSTTGDYGIMQINIINHQWLREKLNIDDFLDPYDSINAGTYMLGNAIKKYGDVEKALVAYNAGDGGADAYFAQGVYSTPYSRRVLEAEKEIRK